MQTFLAALKEPVLETCTRLLTSGQVTASERDRYGRTPLHLACAHNRPSIVRLLLHHGARISEADFDGKTALMTACEAGNLQVVEALAEVSGLDLHLRDHMGNTAVMHAAYKGHLQVLKLLAASQPRLHLDEQEFTGKTCLHLAVLQSALGVTRWLVKQGCALDTIDFAGNSALHYAAEKAHVKAVEALLVGGARVDVADYEGKSALGIACRQGSWRVASALLVSGASVAWRDHYGWVPLMHAAQSKNLDLLRELVRRGADVDAKDNEGKTVLIQAVESGLPAVVEGILACHADLALKTHTGDTALHVAVICDEGRMVSACVDAWRRVGLDPKKLCDSQNFEGKTPLILAAMNGLVEIMQKLVAFGADLDKRDYSGSTALMWTVWNDHYSAAEQLLEAGALVDAEDYFGKTALILAAMGESFEIVELLLRFGADWSIKDHLGFNAWSRACENNSKEIMTLLDSLDPEETQRRASHQESSFDASEEIDSQEEDEIFAKFDLDKDALHSLAHTEETDRTISCIKESLRSRFLRRGVKAYPIKEPGLSGLGELMRSKKQQLKVHIFDCFTNTDVLGSIDKLCAWLEQFPVDITKDLAPFAQTGSSCGIVAAFAQHDLYTTFKRSPDSWRKTLQRELKERLCGQQILVQAEEILDQNETIEPISVHPDLLLTDIQVRALVEGLCHLDNIAVPEELQLPMSVDYVAFNIARVLYKEHKLDAAARQPRFWIVNTETFEDPGKLVLNSGMLLYF